MSMKQLQTIGIVAGGPSELIPDLTQYAHIDYWIGVDHGAVTMTRAEMTVDLAIGDFDSISHEAYEQVQTHAQEIKVFPADKDLTDLELAIDEAIALNADDVFIFGASGGRLDHAWVNMFLLTKLAKADITAWLVDRQNQMTINYPGEFTIEKEDHYPYVSFLSISEQVKGLSLRGFLYNLEDATISLGSSYTVSNECIEKNCTYSFTEGILLVIKSRD